jgi:hypothetical protein
MALPFRDHGAFDVAKLVDFHIVFVDGPDIYSDFKANQPSSQSYVHIVDAAQHIFRDIDCEDIISKGFANAVGVTANYEAKGVPYPVNLMRNVPRWYLRTPHVLMLDCDMIPSIDLAYEYERAYDEYSREHAGADMGKVAFVAPGIMTSITCIAFLASC